MLDVLVENGEKVRKGAFYISYDNYKNNFSKVYFKLNNPCPNPPLNGPK